MVNWFFLSEEHEGTSKSTSYLVLGLHNFDADIRFHRVWFTFQNQTTLAASVGEDD